MIARVSSWKELERWIPGGEASWEAAFPLVPIGDVMHIRRTVVSRQQFSGATGTSPTMKNISKPSPLDLVIPLPMGSDGLKIQARLIERLESNRSRAAAKRTEAERLRSQAWADFLGAIFN